MSYVLLFTICRKTFHDGDWARSSRSLETLLHFLFTGNHKGGPNGYSQLGLLVKASPKVIFQTKYLRLRETSCWEIVFQVFWKGQPLWVVGEPLCGYSHLSVILRGWEAKGSPGKWRLGEREGAGLRQALGPYTSQTAEDWPSPRWWERGRWEPFAGWEPVR